MGPYNRRLSSCLQLAKLGPSLTHTDGKGMGGGFLFSKIPKEALFLSLTQ